jgi:hypothetical protein
VKRIEGRIAWWLVLSFGVVLAFSGRGAAGAQAESPRTFLADIYTHYTDAEAPVLAWNGEDAPALFEPRLAAAIIADSDQAAQRGEVSAVLDYDPFVQGQDYEIRGLTISIEEAAANAATALVMLRNSGKPVTIRYDLVRLADGWRIRDMRWGKTSLRALLKLR